MISMTRKRNIPIAKNYIKAKLDKYKHVLKVIFEHVVLL